MLTKYQQFFTGRPTTEIAQHLLGKMVKYKTAAGTIGGYIVETEAYLGEHDTASHAFNGRRTGYSESLYGMPGNIYLYQIRGHYCFEENRTKCCLYIYKENRLPIFKYMAQTCSIAIESLTEGCYGSSSSYGRFKKF